MWALPWQLRDKGIIGMNRRNIRYIARYNDRRLYPLVDDKLQTKLLAKDYGITTPDLIGTVRSQFEVKQVARLVADHPGFAIKPSKGSSGKGILVIEGRDGDKYVKPSGALISSQDIERHVSNILSGLYSLGGSPDVAIVEQLIHFDERFADFTYEGVPDIRVIIFRGYPVMAMMRLSTAASDGKANLHQGAVGLGLDIGHGSAVRAVQFDRACHQHPDTGKGLFSLRVPDWDTLLHLSARCYEMTGLGYLGVDLALDRKIGPMLLELNARPGLAIQMANGEGLRRRLDLIEQQADGRTVEERVAFSVKHFSRTHPAEKNTPDQPPAMAPVPVAG